MANAVSISSALSSIRGFRRKYPHVLAATKYAEDVVDGKIPACKFVVQACARQLRDLERDDFGFVFDYSRAEAICAFISTLPHIKGEWASRGERIRLEPWQAFYLTTIFGWVDETGRRRFRTAYIEIPRKNAKSSIAAGVALYMLTLDKEAGAEVYSAATTRNQAKIVFDVAKQMAKRATALTVRSHTIADLNTASKFEPLHAQGETLDGYNISCAINDELHAWKKRSVYDVIETAMGSRVQPLMFNITTAGDNLEGICFDVRGYALRALAGTLDPPDDTFFAIIYTIDVEDGKHWFDEEIWKKANPNWGVSVYPFDVRALAKKARELPSETNAFLTKRLNVWVNAAIAWMDMLRWQLCFDSSMRIEDFFGLPCYAGVDLASKIDVNSLAVLFKRKGEDGREHYYVFMKHWLPEAAITGDRFGQYDGWVRMGAITKTAGNVIDTKIIEKDIIEISQRHSLTELGIDPGHNSTQIGVNVSETGVKVVDVRPVPMNFSEPMKWLEAWVKDGTLHFCDPVLTWMVGNVVAKRDHKDNIYPRKENVGRKIDGIIALLIAINRLKMGTSDEKAYTVLLV